MEFLDSPLNQAHFFANKAEAAYKKKNWDAAIQYHQQAAEFLAEAKGLISDGTGLESIVLQEKYHLRQVELLIVRKEKAATEQKPSSPNTVDEVRSQSCQLSRVIYDWTVG
ncbi:hypothetical protein HELRODRAFT_184013 [Helobdella robusta]|uniref:Nuclear receptor-binding factor 2 MIT domain-containing protein n=1 Tax=Helobdella robusta TaxID=6412 RepID=T1FKF3_HELRO|nr:hypothetical protein HELRODRAFT_184013 [Helobdella robusta]ESO09623.1 hypothetical protein HELRODRAFT_184013 [Helobdella robusta]